MRRSSPQGVPASISSWQEWRTCLFYFFLGLFFAALGIYGVIYSFADLVAHDRSFHFARVLQRRSPEWRILFGGAYGLMGISLAMAYGWWLLTKIPKRHCRDPRVPDDGASQSRFP